MDSQARDGSTYGAGRRVIFGDVMDGGESLILLFFGILFLIKTLIDASFAKKMFVCGILLLGLLGLSYLQLFPKSVFPVIVAVNIIFFNFILFLYTFRPHVQIEYVDVVKQVILVREVEVPKEVKIYYDPITGQQLPEGVEPPDPNSFEGNSEEGNRLKETID